MNLDLGYNQLGSIHRQLSEKYLKEVQPFMFEIVRLESIIQEHRLHPLKSHIAKNKSELIDAVNKYFTKENELSRQEKYWHHRLVALDLAVTGYDGVNEKAITEYEGFPLGFLNASKYECVSAKTKKVDSLLKDQWSRAHSRVIDSFRTVTGNYGDEKYFNQKLTEQLRSVLPHVLAVWCHGSIEEYTKNMLPFSLPHLPEIIVEKFGEKIHDIVSEEYTKLFTFQGEQLMRSWYDEK